MKKVRPYRKKTSEYNKEDWFLLIRVIFQKTYFEELYKYENGDPLFSTYSELISFFKTHFPNFPGLNNSYKEKYEKDHKLEYYDIDGPNEPIIKSYCEAYGNGNTNDFNSNNIDTSKLTRLNWYYLVEKLYKLSFFKEELKDKNGKALFKTYSKVIDLVKEHFCDFHKLEEDVISLAKTEHISTHYQYYKQYIDKKYICILNHYDDVFGVLTSTSYLK